MISYSRDMQSCTSFEGAWRQPSSCTVVPVRVAYFYFVFAEFYLSSQNQFSNSGKVMKSAHPEEFKTPPGSSIWPFYDRCINQKQNMQLLWELLYKIFWLTLQSRRATRLSWCNSVNSFKILISFPSKFWDFAKFFFVMAFIATTLFGAWKRRTLNI